jgi:uncharacterized protein (DUF1501 family)
MSLSAEVGMPPELTASQLLIAGLPVEWIRARFPTVAKSTARRHEGLLAEHLGVPERALESSVFPDSGAARPLTGLVRA